MRDQVFISYSHRDETWKDKVVSQLRVLAREGAFDLWDDRRIAAGEGWRAEIETAIEHAQAAVLLISADFLNSEFIRGTEVPRLLQRRAKDGLRIIPLIVRPCPWRRVPWLAEIQGRPTDGRPLSKSRKAEVEEDLSALAEEIADLLQQDALEVGRAGDPGTAGVSPAQTPSDRGATASSTPAQVRGERAGRPRSQGKKPPPLSTSAACPSPACTSSAGRRRSPVSMPPGTTRPSMSSPWWPSEASASPRWSPAGWTAWRPTAGAVPRGCSTGRSTARAAKTESPPPSRSSTTPSASSAIPTPRPAPCTTAAPVSPI